MRKQAFIRIGAFTMAVLIVIGIIPVSIMAAGDSSQYQIEEFAPLEPSVAAQAVPLGTSASELDLPDKLTVTLSPISIGRSIGESGEEDTLVRGTIPVDSWASSPSYDPSLPGIYIFTPSFPSDWQFPPLLLPQITVEVLAQHDDVSDSVTRIIEVERPGASEIRQLQSQLDSRSDLIGEELLQGEAKELYDVLVDLGTGLEAEEDPADDDASHSLTLNEENAPPITLQKDYTANDVSEAIDHIADEILLNEIAQPAAEAFWADFPSSEWLGEEMCVVIDYTISYDEESELFRLQADRVSFAFETFGVLDSTIWDNFNVRVYRGSNWRQLEPVYGGNTLSAVVNHLNDPTNRTLCLGYSDTTVDNAVIVIHDINSLNVDVGAIDFATAIVSDTSTISSFHLASATFQHDLKLENLIIARPSQSPIDKRTFQGTLTIAGYVELTSSLVLNGGLVLEGGATLTIPDHYTQTDGFLIRVSNIEVHGGRASIVYGGDSLVPLLRSFDGNNLSVTGGTLELSMSGLTYDDVKSYYETHALIWLSTMGDTTSPGYENGAIELGAPFYPRGSLLYEYAKPGGHLATYDGYLVEFIAPLEVEYYDSGLTQRTSVPFETVDGAKTFIDSLSLAAGDDIHLILNDDISYGELIALSFGRECLIKSSPRGAESPNGAFTLTVNNGFRTANATVLENVILDFNNSTLRIDRELQLGDGLQLLNLNNLSVNYDNYATITVSDNATVVVSGYQNASIQAYRLVVGQGATLDLTGTSALEMPVRPSFYLDMKAGASLNANALTATNLTMGSGAVITVADKLTVNSAFTTNNSTLVYTGNALENQGGGGVLDVSGVTSFTGPLTITDVDGNGNPSGFQAADGANIIYDPNKVLTGLDIKLAGSLDGFVLKYDETSKYHILSQIVVAVTDNNGNNEALYGSFADAIADVDLRAQSSLGAQPYRVILKEDFFDGTHGITEMPFHADIVILPDGSAGGTLNWTATDVDTSVTLQGLTLEADNDIRVANAKTLTLNGVQLSLTDAINITGATGSEILTLKNGCAIGSDASPVTLISGFSLIDLDESSQITLAQIDVPGELKSAAIPAAAAAPTLNFTAPCTSSQDANIKLGANGFVNGALKIGGTFDNGNQLVWWTDANGTPPLATQFMMVNAYLLAPVDDSPDHYLVISELVGKIDVNVTEGDDEEYGSVVKVTAQLLSSKGDPLPRKGEMVISVLQDGQSFRSANIPLDNEDTAEFSLSATDRLPAGTYTIRAYFEEDYGGIETNKVEDLRTSLTIAPRKVDVSLSVAPPLTDLVKNKTYDGKDDAEWVDSVNYGSFLTLDTSRVFSGDDISLLSADIAFADFTAGNDRPIMITKIELMGDDKDNYEASLASDGTAWGSLPTNAVIFQQKLTLSITGISKIYDGTTAIPTENLAVNLDGLVTPDSKSTVWIDPDDLKDAVEFDSPNAGSRTIIWRDQTALKLSGQGGAEDNYILSDTFDPDLIDATISRREIDPDQHVIITDPNALTKIFNGKDDYPDANILLVQASVDWDALMIDSGVNPGYNPTYDDMKLGVTDVQYRDVNVGTPDVGVYLTISSQNHENFTLRYITATKQGEITPFEVASGTSKEFYVLDGETEQKENLGNIFRPLGGGPNDLAPSPAGQVNITWDWSPETSFPSDLLQAEPQFDPQTGQLVFRPATPLGTSSSVSGKMTVTASNYTPAIEVAVTFTPIYEDNKLYLKLKDMADLDKTYDGQPLLLENIADLVEIYEDPDFQTPATPPASLSIAVSYGTSGGPISAPVDAGTYTAQITASFVDGNGDTNVGSMSTAIVIRPRPVLIGLPTNSIYWGSEMPKWNDFTCLEDLSPPGNTGPIAGDSLIKILGGEFPGIVYIGPGGVVDTMPRQRVGTYAVGASQLPASTSANYAVNWEGGRLSVVFVPELVDGLDPDIGISLWLTRSDEPNNHGWYAAPFTVTFINPGASIVPAIYNYLSLGRDDNNPPPFSHSGSDFLEFRDDTKGQKVEELLYIHTSGTLDDGAPYWSLPYGFSYQIDLNPPRIDPDVTVEFIPNSADVDMLVRATDVVDTGNPGSGVFKMVLTGPDGKTRTLYPVRDEDMQPGIVEEETPDSVDADGFSTYRFRITNPQEGDTYRFYAVDYAYHKSNEGSFTFDADDLPPELGDITILDDEDANVTGMTLDVLMTDEGDNTVTFTAAADGDAKLGEDYTFTWTTSDSGIASVSFSSVPEETDAVTVTLLNIGAVDITVSARGDEETAQKVTLNVIYAQDIENPDPDEDDLVVHIRRMREPEDTPEMTKMAIMTAESANEDIQTFITDGFVSPSNWQDQTAWWDITVAYKNSAKAVDMPLTDAIEIFLPYPPDLYETWKDYDDPGYMLLHKRNDAELISLAFNEGTKDGKKGVVFNEITLSPFSLTCADGLKDVEGENPDPEPGDDKIIADVTYLDSPSGAIADLIEGSSNSYISKHITEGFEEGDDWRNNTQWMDISPIYEKSGKPAVIPKGELILVEFEYEEKWDQSGGMMLVHQDSNPSDSISIVDFQSGGGKATFASDSFSPFALIWNPEADGNVVTPPGDDDEIIAIVKQLNNPANAKDTATIDQMRNLIARSGNPQIKNYIADPGFGNNSWAQTTYWMDISPVYKKTGEPAVIPAGKTVTVTITGYPGEYNESGSLMLVHQNSASSVTVVDCTFDKEQRKITFESGSFSPFALIWNPQGKDVIVPNITILDPAKQDHQTVISRLADLIEASSNARIKKFITDGFTSATQYRTQTQWMDIHLVYEKTGERVENLLDLEYTVTIDYKDIPADPYQYYFLLVHQSGNNVETVQTTRTNEGVQFTTKDFSPFALVWNADTDGDGDPGPEGPGPNPEKPDPGKGKVKPNITILREANGGSEAEIIARLSALVQNSENTRIQKFITGGFATPTQWRNQTQWMDISLIYEESGAPAPNPGNQEYTITVEYPAGSDPSKHYYLLVHQNGNNSLETMKTTRTNEGIQFTASDFSPFALVWNANADGDGDPGPVGPGPDPGKPGPGPNPGIPNPDGSGSWSVRGGAGSSGNGSYASHGSGVWIGLNFWEQTRVAIRDAQPGDTVLAKAPLGTLTCPVSVLDMLYGKDVTLHITWTGEEIVINGLTMYPPNLNLLVYTLDELAALYGISKAGSTGLSEPIGLQNPVTGGDDIVLLDAGGTPKASYQLIQWSDLESETVAAESAPSPAPAPAPMAVPLPDVSGLLTGSSSFRIDPDFLLIVVPLFVLAGVIYAAISKITATRNIQLASTEAAPTTATRIPPIIIPIPPVELDIMEEEPAAPSDSEPESESPVSIPKPAAEPISQIPAPAEHSAPAIDPYQCAAPVKAAAPVADPYAGTWVSESRPTDDAAFFGLMRAQEKLIKALHRGNISHEEYELQKRRLMYGEVPAAPVTATVPSAPTVPQVMKSDVSAMQATPKSMAKATDKQHVEQASSPKSRGSVQQVTSLPIDEELHNVIAQHRKLLYLLNNGSITREEYERRKRDIIINS